MAYRNPFARLARVVLPIAGVFVAAAAHAQYFLSHSIDLQPGISASDIILFNRNNTDWLTETFSAGPGGTTVVNDPFGRAVSSTLASFVGLDGDNVIIGMNLAAGTAATFATFESVFTGYTEVQIHDAILKITNNTDFSGGLATLFDFFDDHSDKWATVGVQGLTMRFSEGNRQGNYLVTENFQPTSVPEPATMALMASAAGLGYWRRRRAKQTAA